jgi:hypothetical protein
MEFTVSSTESSAGNIEILANHADRRTVSINEIIENIQNTSFSEFTEEALNDLKNGNFVSAGLMVFGKIKTPIK